MWTPPIEFYIPKLIVASENVKKNENRNLDFSIKYKMNQVILES